MSRESGGDFMNELFYDERPLPQVFSQIAGLSEEQFRVLRDAVKGPEGFNDQYERCKRIAVELDAGLGAHDVFKILGSLWYLKTRFREWDNADEDAETATRELLDFLGLDKHLGGTAGDTLFARLGEILAESPEEAEREEVHRLRTGILDTVIDFNSFVDLRPRFSKDMASVEEFIPVVIFRVAVERDFGPEQSYIFQMSPEVTEALRSVLDDVDDQLAALTTRKELGLRPHLLSGEKKGG